MQFLGRVFHDEDAGDAALGLCVEYVDVDAVLGWLLVDLVGDGIPAEGLFGLGQLALFTQHVFHQEVGHVKSAHTVAVVVDIAPATAVGYALVGDVVVHGEELLSHFVAVCGVGSVVVGCGDAPHQVHVVAEVHTPFLEDASIDFRGDTFVGFDLASEEDGHAAHLAVAIGYLIEVVCSAYAVQLLVS